LGDEYCGHYENCGQDGWKFNSEEVNPRRLCEKLKLFLECWSLIRDMGYIESNISNPDYLVGLSFSKLGLSYSTMRLIWSIDSYLDWKNYCWDPYHKQTKTKQKKQITNKKERKIKTKSVLKMT